MTTFDAEFVTIELDEATDGAVASIRIDRPPVNALSRQTRSELRRAAAFVSDDTNVRSVVLCGSQRAFAAGVDITEMADASYTEMVGTAQLIQTTFAEIARIPKPVVAAIRGYALGGGLELALCADVRIIGEDARLGQPEILLGLIPGAGGTQRLTRLIGPSRAKDLVFSGRTVRADEALRIGLADRVVPSEDVDAEALEWARSFARGPAIALSAAKQAVGDGLELELDAALRLETSLFAGLFNTKDTQTGIASFIAHGPGKAAFDGH